MDESGDFGSYQAHSPHYIVAMLFHDQRNEIGNAVKLLDSQVKNLGHEPHALHTGPIIRRESNYINLTVDERKKLLNALVHFCRHVDVKYTILHVDKKECRDIIDLTARISKQIRSFVDKHELFLRAFDEITVYYDNGQIELTQILTSTLSVLLSNISFRRVKPSEYKLFQLIDMFCSLELTALKFDLKIPSRSELEVFHNTSEFKRDYLKKIRKKRLE
ncbi:MAG: DUF3800 domain-containing protein [Oscillospiraceae bacterium]|nr:DUF3800 domain-containing protein [Oscillospiraceae bacterium]